MNEAELHCQNKTKSAKLETGAELLTRILAERRKNGTGCGKSKEPVELKAMAIPLPPVAKQTRIVGKVERRLSVARASSPAG
jgi:hypothetical protein